MSQDITDPCRPSSAQLLLQHIEDLALIGSWELNLEPPNISWSEGVFKILGYDPKTFEVTIETMDQIIHAEDRQRSKALLHDVLASDKPYEIQMRLIAQDGTLRHVLSKASIIRNSAGQPTKLIGMFQDITSFVEIQLNLHKQEDQLNAIIRSEPDCVKIMSAENTLLDMNPAGLKMIEATAPLSDFLNKHLDPLIHPEDLSTYKRLHEQALAGQEGNASFRFIGMQGTERWVESKSVPLKDEHDQIYAVLSLSRDITEKTQLQQEIIRSEKRFRALIENSADAFAIIGTDGSPSYVSPSVTRVLGYSEEEALQLNLFEILHPQELDAITAVMTQSLENPGMPIPGHASRLRHKDGKWRWIDATVTNLLHDPVINGIVDNFKDVTEAKELQILLDNASQLARVGGWEVDLVSERHQWSTVTCDIFEVPHDFKASFEEGFGFYTEAYQTMARQNIELAISENQPFDFEALIVTARGNECWVRCIGRGEWFNGKCVRIFGSIQDIHERKVLELELEQKVQELATSNHELEQFAYIASHDLQEPLRMIDSFLSLLEKRYNHKLDSKAKQYIYFAVDGARRMRQVILALMDFSGVGKEQDPLRHFELTEVLEETLALNRQLIHEKNARIEYKDLPALTSQRTGVQQVLKNLIENALKYSHSDHQPVIKIQAIKHPTEWEITVEDNGIGISPKYHEKIFIIFQRLHLRHEYSGTGIGLAIVKKIVEGMGGKIWVDSEEGSGSTFHFTLKTESHAHHRRHAELQSTDSSHIS
jgi:PAS domain S-box-containing protein